MSAACQIPVFEDLQFVNPSTYAWVSRLTNESVDISERRHELEQISEAVGGLYFEIESRQVHVAAVRGLRTPIMHQVRRVTM
jgi:hypothetical protein